MADENIKVSKIEINDFFSTKNDISLEYPLNIIFECKVNKNNKPNFLSNGIYFILEKETNYVIYIGINLSKNPNYKNFVDEERIKKHLQSFTMRGSKIGISGKKKDWFSKCDKINEHLFSLKDKIPNKDTGTTSDKNRIYYANIYWNKFKKDDNFTDILNNQFYAYYFKINFFDNLMKEIFSKNLESKIAKKIFRKKIVNFFEEPLSEEFRPYIYQVKKSKKYPYSGKWNSKIFNLKDVKKSISILIKKHNIKPNDRPL